MRPSGVDKEAGPHAGASTHVVFNPNDRRLEALHDLARRKLLWRTRCLGRRTTTCDEWCRDGKRGDRKQCAAEKRLGSLTHCEKP